MKKKRPELYNLGEIPPLGVVPQKMWASVIRRERYGEPRNAFRSEIVDIPSLGKGEVLVLVMAAGINYNNVWAALGQPTDVIGARLKSGSGEEFHIGGSEGAGVIWALSDGVEGLRVGDEIVLYGGQWDPEDPFIKRGGDPTLAPTARVWGYETNWGSFGQFSRVQAHQCLPKPKDLTWEEAATYLLVSSTAHRMLAGWPEHRVKEGDVVLIWGGAGGLGSAAIQLVRRAGGIPMAIVSSEERKNWCLDLGVVGVIDRTAFHHWGPLPSWRDKAGYQSWLQGARSFGEKIWDLVGERQGPFIVFEHVGEETLPTSIFVCRTGGMVVICGASSGYLGTLDLRYLWMRQKRLQGSHGANLSEAQLVNRWFAEGRLKPFLTKTWRFEEIGEAHQLLLENRQPPGKMAVLVMADRPGLKTLT